jgi:F-type H+-transporting ATPase subunit delta
MKISKQARREAKELFRACLVAGRLDENRVRGAVRGVIDVKPRGYLGVLEHFQRLVHLEIDRRRAQVESAVPLSAELQDRVSRNLARHYGEGLNIAFGVDPGLIGGVRVRVGSDILDGSIRGRLDILSEQFQIEVKLESDYE